MAISIIASPRAHTSDAGVQGDPSLILSGAKKHCVPIKVIANVSAVSLETPKSAILACPEEEKRILLGLMSILYQ